MAARGSCWRCRDPRQSSKSSAGLLQCGHGEAHRGASMMSRGMAAISFQGCRNAVVDVLLDVELHQLQVQHELGSLNEVANACERNRTQ